MLCRKMRRLIKFINQKEQDSLENLLLQRSQLKLIWLFIFTVQIQFDNSNHDGRVPVILNSQGSTVDCQANSTGGSEGILLNF